MDLAEGIELFNSGQYHEAHEVWEKRWLEADKDSPEKHFIQGLIMIASALSHFKKGEFAGTEKLLDSGLRRIVEHRDMDCGIDVEEFINDINLFYEEFNTAREEISEEDFPEINSV